MRDITLTRQNATDPYLLVPPSQRHLGGDEPDIETDRLRLRIGDRPIARNLRRLYELGNRQMPDNLEVFTSYDLWLLTHAVSVIKEGGYKRVRHLGYRMSFHEKPRVTVVEVLPQTRFVTKIGGFLRAETDIQLNGEAKVPDNLIALLEEVESFSLGGQIRFSAEANVVGRVSFSVMTPVIEAVGIGSSSSEWVFRKDSQPLLGDQLMIQIVLTPRRLRKIKLRAQLHVTITTFNFLPVRLESDWLELECELR